MQQLPLSGLKKEENAKGQRANGKGGKALRNGLVECGAGASADASAGASAGTDMKNNQPVPWWGECRYRVHAAQNASRSHV